jgi:acetyl-CoA/propionyl-CoA carboxylase biotin carboxyl carrier protein
MKHLSIDRSVPAGERPPVHRVSATPAAARVDGVPVDLRRVGPGEFSALVDGRMERLHVVQDGDTVHVQLRGRAWRLERIDPTLASGPASEAQGRSLAPMPGVVTAVLARAGQRVSRGDPLLVIESMKLQTTIVAAIDGELLELASEVGASFERGALLAHVHPHAEGAPR